MINPTDNMDDDDSNHSKLEKRNNTTKIVKDFLVDTNVDNFYMAMMIIIVHVLCMNPDRT